MRAERVAAFERDERLVIEVQEMHEHLVHAGSWHVYHCLPAGRCSCDKTTRTETDPLPSSRTSY